MKKTIKFIAFILLIFILGCAQEEIKVDHLEEEYSNSKSSENILTIEAFMPNNQNIASSKEYTNTRIALTQEELDVTLAWEIGDQIELVVAGTTEIQKPIVEVDPANSRKAIFEVVLPDNPTYPLTIYGVYGGGGIDPANPTRAILPSTENSFAGSITELSAKNSVMLKFKAVIESSDAPIAVTFDHVGTLFSIELRNMSTLEWIDIQSIQLSADDEIGAYVGGNMDLETGAITGSLGNTLNFTLPVSTSLAVGATQVFWGWMVPANIANWPALTFKVNGETEMTTSPARSKPEVGRAYYLRAGHKKSSYQLSADGKTLTDWNDDGSSIIDMNSDYILREVTGIADQGFAPAGGVAQNYHTKEIVVGDKVKSIGNSALSGYRSLEKITISPVLETLGNQVFRNNQSLKSIEFPTTFNSGGSRIFYNCTLLDTIIFNSTTPASVTDNPYYSTSFTTIGTIYVPLSSITAYQEHNWWGRANIESIESLNPEGIDSVSDDTNYLNYILDWWN